MKTEQGASVQAINERAHTVDGLQFLDVDNSRHGEIRFAEHLSRHRGCGNLRVRGRCWDGFVCCNIGGAYRGWNRVQRTLEKELRPGPYLGLLAVELSL